MTLAPDNALVNYAMGAVSMHRHEPAEALPYFRRTAADAGRPAWTLRARRGAVPAGQIEQAAQDLHEAARREQTRRRRPLLPGADARDANDLERRGAKSPAPMRPTSQTRGQSGLIETRAGNYDAAQKALDKALQLDPENYLATVNLTTLYTRTKGSAARGAGRQARRTAAEARGAAQISSASSQWSGPE